MPNENKHTRGRREEKKRKRDNDEELNNDPKRTKHPAAGDEDPENNVQISGTDNFPRDDAIDEDGPAERPFYGMLEDEEQEYFRHADELLEQNDFPDDEQRSFFLANVFREADGKELKIACSQSCSRLMERLILLSTTAQKKNLFEKFSGNFAHLVQHRFASHCCEALFIHSAPAATEELTANPSEADESTKSMETYFLSSLDELEGQMTFLLTDRFASHTLRVLLVILSGRVLENTSTKTLLQSKKKETITINNLDATMNEMSMSLEKRSVPSSFQFAVEKIISDTIATMDTSFIRILATHPTGNPTLQLLLELELTNPTTKKGANSDQKTIISSLLPDDIAVEGSESAVFVNGILYDPIGSRLLETIMTCAPAKVFKQVYRTVFEERIAALARNEIASYVVIKVLNRLSRQDLEDVTEKIIPNIDDLLERRPVVIKTLLERTFSRNGKIFDIANGIAMHYNLYEKQPKHSTSILALTNIPDIEALAAQVLPTPEIDLTASPGTPIVAVQQPQTQPPKPTPAQMHGSYLAQSMLQIPTTCEIIQNAILALPPKHIMALALWPCTSHILQISLKPYNNAFGENTLPSEIHSSNMTYRRKLINSLVSTENGVATLALSPAGTHVLDAILLSAPSMLSVIERIAFKHVELEAELRNSYSGRIVWRNWSMDLFRRKRRDWIKRVQGTSEQAVRQGGYDGAPDNKDDVKTSPKTLGKAGAGGKAIIGAKASSGGKAGGVKGKHGKVDESGKTPIELAREKYAANKAKKGTGVNKIVV